MSLVLILIILAILFGIGGVFLHILWIVAVVLVVAWLVALVIGRGSPRV
jgi:hypothetical protein